ncbi:hypothetical protein Gotri_019250 [Gossypium trilobum]|uniref:Thioredoxin domain-containing protein n=1 Tax=Gossypium trilobum TaxID=34281 RepID=A0A7J9ECZ9_9ROSI|nr:hypothetical protein [Gossypium trilobum]
MVDLDVGICQICQLAEMNPDVQFLKVNYEEHKSMCYSLNVHVLPFFRFYRGAQGRLCSFSCTNATLSVGCVIDEALLVLLLQCNWFCILTIKKFKDALAKHSPDRCSLGPTKGLEEKELLALAANKDLSFNYTPKPFLPTPFPLYIYYSTISMFGFHVLIYVHVRNEQHSRGEAIRYRLPFGVAGYWIYFLGIPACLIEACLKSN